MCAKAEPHYQARPHPKESELGKVFQQLAGENQPETLHSKARVRTPWDPRKNHPPMEAGKRIGGQLARRHDTNEGHSNPANETWRAQQN